MIRVLVWLAERIIRSLMRRARRHGTLLLQQTFENGKPGWQAQLRANGERRFSWVWYDDTVLNAVRGVIKEAEENPIGAKPEMVNAPILGGKEFDE